MVHDAVPDIWLPCIETMQNLWATGGRTFKRVLGLSVHVNNSRNEHRKDIYISLFKENGAVLMWDEIFSGAGSDFFKATGEFREVNGSIEKTTGMGGDRDQNASSTARHGATQDKEFWNIIKSNYRL